MKSKNKNNKNNKNKNKKYIKRNYKRFRMYSYKIKTALVTYVTPTYTEQNLNFQLYHLLRETDVFQYLSKQYQQFKIDRVTFIGIPRVVNALDPSPIWVYLDTSGSDSFNYQAIPQLQGSRSLPIKHVSLTKFSNTGRQNDFHYWYDVEGSNSLNGDMSLRVHSEVLPSDKRYWQFQLEYSVKFRGLIVPMGEETKISGLNVEIPKINGDGTNNIVAEQEYEVEEMKETDSKVSTNI